VKFIRDATSVVVDERGGDKPKTKWDELANGDYVSVCWKFQDNPRKAYKVQVRPAPQEAAEEE
jgi:hypothetical protein